MTLPPLHESEFLDTHLLKQPEQVAHSADVTGKKNLIGLPRTTFQALFAEHNIEKLRAQQVWQWMYKRGVTDFAAMSNINQATREMLAQHFIISRAAISKDAVSFDDTRKWLVQFADGNEVETVFIPDPPRGTLCISSQVGCTLSCTFCHTGTQKLVRNLTAADMVTQVMMARDGLADWHGSPGSSRTDVQRKVSNIVFMGMGEPLYNYEQVIQALLVLTDNEGLAFSRRKVTVSTSGVVPMIYQLGKDVCCNLAISLHAVTNALRDEIVPINRKYPIEELLAACRAYPEVSASRRIMFEYVMLKGINDSDADARELVRLLKDIPAKVNLIPFNPWPGAPYACSSNNRIHSFGRILMAHGIASPIRKTRGQDILAACGQLKSISERKKGQKVKL